MWAKVMKVVKDEKTGRAYCGASLGSEIEDEGRRRIHMYDGQWTLKPLTHRVANLFKATRICDAVSARREFDCPRRDR